MHPVLIEFTLSGQTKTITAYGVFAVLGIFLGAFLITYLARKKGIDSFTSVNAIALLVSAGIAMSVIVNLVIFLPIRLSTPNFFDYPVGVVSWGGVLGGALAALYIARSWKIPLLKLADYTVPGVALGFAFGRVGCHFAGCCFGLHYEGPLALHFSHPIAPASTMTQPLFPIQLLSALLLFLLAGLLTAIALKRVREGFGLFTYIVLYALGRFTVEFFRADPRGMYFGFSDAQWYSAFLFTGAILLYFRLKHKDTVSLVQKNV